MYKKRGMIAVIMAAVFGLLTPMAITVEASNGLSLPMDMGTRIEKIENGMTINGLSSIGCGNEEWKVLYGTNLIRMGNGLEPLSVFGTLQAASDVRAVELQSKMDHTRPDGSG